MYLTSIPPYVRVWLRQEYYPVYSPHRYTLSLFNLALLCINRMLDREHLLAPYAANFEFILSKIFSLPLTGVVRP